MTKSMIKPFVIGVSLILSFSLFGQTSNNLENIILDDISNRFQVTIPGEFNKTIKQTEVFKVAIIPIDLIGTIKLPWHDNKEQLSSESEVEFENNMLNCVSGKDWKFVKISRRKQYCERIGYSDAAMGKYFELHYCSFVKENKLVIIEYGMKFSTCTNEKSVKENKRCELEKNKKQKFIDIGITDIIFRMKIVKN